MTKCDQFVRSSNKNKEFTCTTFEFNVNACKWSSE